MSLIKEALDKAQEEGDQPSDESHPDAEEVPQSPEEPSDDREGETREISLSTVLASVAIVILAALIGGQLVLLAAMFVF